MGMRLLRRLSLEAQLAWMMAGLVGCVVLLLTGVLTSLMRSQIERDKGVTLAALGRSITVALGEDFRDRMHQVESLTEDADLWRSGLGSDAVWRALERVSSTPPVPAWVGVIDRSGRVVAATQGLLLGQDVSERPWFAPGLRGPYVGDLHRAKLLGKLLPAPAGGEPLRLVDFSAPILHEGRALGVVASHGDAQGIQDIVSAYLPKNAAERRIEVFVMARSGDVVFGVEPDARVDLTALGQALEARAKTAPGEQARPAVDVAWHDGHSYLTTLWTLDEHTPGWSLGWHVLVRQPVEIAYAPAREAATRALSLGLLAALGAVALGGLAGRRLTLPLRQIAVAASDVTQGRPDASIPLVDGNREVAQLSSALHAMTTRLEALVSERTGELRAANEALRALGEQQVAMLDNELVGIVRLDMRSCTSLWHNRAMARIFGYEMRELDGQSARILYGDDATFAKVQTEAYAAFSRGAPYVAKIPMVRKDGERLWIHLQGSGLKERPDEAIWMMTDVTSQHQYQEQVEHIAFHDPLTGLANRLLLADRIQQAIGSVARSGDLVAVAYLDLDGFKAVNDHHGHDAGDELLKTIAARLSACVREGDTLARLGGDEFVIVLTALKDRAQCEQVLNRVLSDVSTPVTLRHGVQVQVSASIGVAAPTEGGTPGSDLLAAADAAMYAVKRSGKGRIEYALQATAPAAPTRPAS